MIKRYLKTMDWRYCLLMCAGNLLIGMGVSIFKMSGMGNDPFNAMSMALSENIGISYANMVVLINVFLFMIEILLGKRYIGLGTIVNALLIGYIATFFNQLFTGCFGNPSGMVVRIGIMCIGVLIMGLGLSLYQMSDVGVAPFDSLSLIMAEKQKKIPYFWCRISTDACCALICYMAGGLVGIGTVVSVCFLGTVAQFFNVHITEKIMKAIT